MTQMDSCYRYPLSKPHDTVIVKSRTLLHYANIPNNHGDMAIDEVKCH